MRFASDSRLFSTSISLGLLASNCYKVLRAISLNFQSQPTAFFANILLMDWVGPDAVILIQHSYAYEPVFLIITGQLSLPIPLFVPHRLALYNPLVWERTRGSQCSNERLLSF
jgi:hypothetical protein